MAKADDRVGRRLSPEGAVARGEGPESAQLMFVGEQPRFVDDLRFVASLV
jgi:uracil-DNA glycosylase